MNNKDMPAYPVSKKHVYKAVRNYIANELGIGRDEILAMIKQGAESAAEKMCGQINLFGIAQEQMRRNMYSIERQVAQTLADSLEIRPKAALAELENGNG